MKALVALVAPFVIAGLLLGCNARPVPRIIGIVNYPERATLRATRDSCIWVKKIPSVEVYSDGSLVDYDVATMVNRCLNGEVEK